MVLFSSLLSILKAFSKSLLLWISFTWKAYFLTFLTSALWGDHYTDGFLSLCYGKWEPRKIKPFFLGHCYGYWLQPCPWMAALCVTSNFDLQWHFRSPGEYFNVNRNILSLEQIFLDPHRNLNFQHFAQIFKILLKLFVQNNAACIFKTLSMNRFDK